MKFTTSSITSISTSILLLFTTLTNALDLDINSFDSIYAASRLVASGLMDYYWGTKPGGTIGMFTNPYYWWEAGGAWGTMIDYWYYMQNDTYADVIYESLLYQTGDDYNYMPLNQTTTEGNDDQVFWGIAAMQAAERNFTNPPDKKQQWLYLAQGVFNTMAWRWDDDTCNGGLRWQIFRWNAGYDYKNSVSNIGLFHMGARLARYTGNDSYVDWSEKVYDWLNDTGLVSEGKDWWFVYDGTGVETNCTQISKLQWTYNVGLMISGCAYFCLSTFWKL
ncbi:unnamed protein product [Ambrosiozyma monospora]|uniref:Unnamed protein product n=1 Tax=Ambrosiozyma monospora TaxID=43982 RepID=A0ACB5T038_AMBMO|nr:unnamed protein product [Ambrosiozyma monospora]